VRGSTHAREKNQVIARGFSYGIVVCCSVSVLQCVAVRCSVSFTRVIARVPFIVLQCVAVSLFCSVVQYLLLRSNSARARARTREACRSRGGGARGERPVSCRALTGWKSL